MKKFILGFVCGALVTIPMGVFASSQINACLFPSKVTIYKDGSSTAFDANDSPFINYNNRIYVPLRAFSEAMGSCVNFEAASSTNGNINTIEVKDLDSIEPSLQDKDGYVSLYITSTELFDNGDKIVSGLIKINKDITGKTIDYANSLVIDNQLTQPIQMGQTRNFHANIGSSSFDDDHLSVEVKTWGEPGSFMRGGVGTSPSGDLGILFVGAGKGLDTPISISGRYYPLDGVDILNNTDKTISLISMNLTYNIYKIESNKDTLICSYNIPPFKAETLELPPYTGTSVSIPAWDFKDKKGKTVLPGKYAITLSTPQNFQYYYQGKLETLPVKGNIRGIRYEFALIN